MLSVEGFFKDFDPERNDIITRFSGLNKIAFLQKEKKYLFAHSATLSTGRTKNETWRTTCGL